MGFLNKWFGRRQAQARQLDRCKSKLDSFMRPSMSLVDTRDMSIPERRQRYVRFVYGAIHALSEKYEMDETERLAVLVMFLKTTAQMHEREVSKLVADCTKETEGTGSQSTTGKGYEAMRQWLDGDAGAAVSRLGGALKA